MTRVLGIDPGLRVTAYGAIDVAADGAVTLVEAGVVTPDVRAPLERRLGQLHRELSGTLASLRPDVVAIEELWTSYKNPTTAVLMGHARGVICLAADTGGVRLRHLGHALVKRVITGSGGARKEQVNRMVVTQLRLTRPPQPNDVSDALALALVCANVERVDVRAGRLGIA